MGTYVNAICDHRLTDHRDLAAVISTLGPSVPAAVSVEDYWAVVGQGTRPDGTAAWTPLPMSPHESRFVRLVGPGPFFLNLTERAARIEAGGRWRGFLSIVPLREVHSEGFRAIGRSLGASALAFFPDDDDVIGGFWDGATLEECVSLLVEKYGPPQPSVEHVSPEVAAETDHGVPFVWYFDRLVGGPS